MYWNLFGCIATCAWIFSALYKWARENPALAIDNHPVEFYGPEHREY